MIPDQFPITQGFGLSGRASDFGIRETGLDGCVSCEMFEC